MPRGWVRGRRTPIVLLTTASLAALLSVVAAPVAQSQTTPSCTDPGPPLVANAYLMPAWSDTAGWYNDDQGRTIVSGDVDGDGIGELIGRNAVTFETYTWDRPYGTVGVDGNPVKFYDPVPGQWLQVLPKAAPPRLATEDGWWDPSRYLTVRLADIDNKTDANGDELIIRTPSGLWIYPWDKTAQTWAAPIKTPVFSDTDGFGQSHPEHYETIMTGNVDGTGGDEILGRGAAGIQTWTLNAAGDGLTRLDANATIMADPPDNVWDKPEYWSTIRVGNVTGGAADELLARGGGGMEVWTLDAANQNWKGFALLTDWSDEAGWNAFDAYSTISVGDVSGDGLADVLSRAPSGDGIDAFTVQADGTWVRLAPRGGFTDGAGFGKITAYETIQVADVVKGQGETTPKNEVIGRNLNGMYHMSIESGQWVIDQVGISQFSDANGWDSSRAFSIRAVTVGKDQPQVIIGRDKTGIRTLRFDDNGQDSLSAPFPAYTNLAGIPNGLNTPPAQLPATDEGRAYWYINAMAHQQFWKDASDDQTILQQYRDPTQQGNLSSLNGILAGGGFDPGKDTALNVPRATYDLVNQDVNDWTSAVTTTYGHLLGDQGMQQLILQTFVTNAGVADTIASGYGSNPALEALVGDLLWGVIGLLGAVGVLIPGIGEAEIAAIAGFAGFIGSGVAAGVGFVDPGAGVDAEAAELDELMVNTFCGASTFVEDSFDQIVQDYGLLATTARMFERTPSTAPLFAHAKTVMVSAQELWVWQQFANMLDGSNMWAGWCDFSDGPGGCSWVQNAPATWNAPENPNISYRLVGERVGSQGTAANCGYSVLENTDNARLINLKPSLAAIMAPRQTDTGTAAGTPRNSRMGTQGWDVGQAQCD